MSEVPLRRPLEHGHFTGGSLTYMAQSKIYDMHVVTRHTYIEIHNIYRQPTAREA